MPPTTVQQDLIFDLGMHYALDAKFYVDKGFRVVALEANPELVVAAFKKYGEAVAAKRLFLEQKALWSTGEPEIKFYVNLVKDDWSSAFQNWAQKEGHETREISVKTTTLSQMFDQHGVPYYVKCDVEGADELFVRQLLADARRPAFVSIEAVSLDALALLFAAGYDRVQIVNQAFNGYTVPPQPPREGRYIAIQFNGHMSGLFGRELDPDKWLSFSDASEAYIDFMRLTKRHPMLAHGWLDFHVTTRGTIEL